MNQLSSRLRKTVEHYHTLLEKIDQELAGNKPSPEKWSKKEILGHLIDSAANNHHRFVRIQVIDELVFDGYDQEQWVSVQNYQNKKWKDIVELWFYYNLHLSDVISQILEETLNKERSIHNLYKIAFKTIPASEPTTLAYFVDDYINHLEHHLRQILE